MVIDIAEYRRLKGEIAEFKDYLRPGPGFDDLDLGIGEIRLGIERLRRKDQEQADLLEQWLRGLQVTYADHVVEVDAASARARGWTMVTRNTGDLARSGVPVINPFDPPPGSRSA